MCVSVFRPIRGSSDQNVSVIGGLRRHHVHDVLVVLEEHARNRRRSTWIRVSEHEYPSVPHGLAVRRWLAKRGRQSERWDDEPLSRLAILLYVGMVMPGTRCNGGKEER